MSTQRITKVFVVLTVVLAWCCRVSDGEIFCPPALAGQDYVVTTELYGQFDPAKTNTLTTTVYRNSDLVGTCSWFSLQCTIEPQYGSYRLDFKRIIFGPNGNDLQVTLTIPNFPPNGELVGNYIVEWTYDSGSLKDSCTINYGQPVDECSTLQPCVNAGTCNDLPSGYECICYPGYGGLNCTSGDHSLFCNPENSGLRFPFDVTLPYVCSDLKVPCYLAGLDTTRGIIGNVKNESQPVPYVDVQHSETENNVTFDVCIYRGITLNTEYQVSYQIQASSLGTGVYNFTFRVIVVAGGPTFSVQQYKFSISETLGDGDTIVYVNKSQSQTCFQEDDCIQIIDNNPDTLSLHPYLITFNTSAIQFQSQVDNLSLGYFYVSGNLTFGGLVVYGLDAYSSQGTGPATVTFTITEENNPPVCNLTKIEITLDIRTQYNPYMDVATVHCSDPDYEEKFRKINYTVEGSLRSQFFVTSDGVIQLYSSLMALDAGVYNFSVKATGYSNPPDSAFEFEIPVSVTITVPQPVCNLTIDSLPSPWEVKSTAVLSLECDIFGIDKLRITAWNFLQGFDIQERKETSSVIKLDLTLNSTERSLYNLTVAASLGGMETLSSVTLPVFNPPKFESKPIDVTILDTAQNGSLIATLKAKTDTPQASLMYRRISGGDGVIEVQSDGGLLLLSKPSLKDSPIVAVVEVQDDISNLTDRANVTITVEDGNEPPVCQPSMTSVLANLAVGSVITTLNCCDPDDRQDYRELTYRIINIEPSSVIVSVGSNGEIKLEQILPSGIQDVNVTVNVSDRSAQPQSTLVNAIIYVTVVKCPLDRRPTGVIFPETVTMSTGVNITVQCPLNYSGNITRSCYFNETWGSFTYNNCRRINLENATRIVQDLLNNPGTASSQNVTNIVKAVADDLINSLAGSPTILSGDITQIVDILSTIGELTQRHENVTIDDDTLRKYVKITNALLSANVSSWVDAQGDERKLEQGAHLIKAMDEISMTSLRNFDSSKSQPIVTDNVAVERNESLDDIVFPNQMNVNYMTYGPMAFLSKEAFNHVQGPVSYSVVVYKNDELKLRVSPELQKGTLKGKQINSDIISFSLSVNLPELSPPLQLTFPVINESYSSPTCAFLQTSERVGVWSDVGCTTKNVVGDKVECECNHLTNFALLMNPYGSYPSPKDEAVLSIISAVGCGISILCLVVTIIVYAVLWKYVTKNDRAMPALHIHLCVCLILAYIIFLAGVDKTENEIPCKVVAALLHYVYLVVFFVMLSIGIQILKSVSDVFSLESILWKLIPFAYGVPLVIVAISLGVTRTEGYGTKRFCWLSVEDGVIWAFVGPALLVLVINVIVLLHILRIMQSTRAMMSKTTKQRTKSVIRTVFLLSPLLGITWLFGILSINENFIAFQYLFAIFNSLQGLFIFIFLCLMNHQVRDGLRSMKRKHQARSFDSGQRVFTSSDSRGHSYSDSNSSSQNNASSSLASPVTKRTFDFNTDMDMPLSNSLSSNMNSSGGRWGRDPQVRHRQVPELWVEGIPFDPALMSPEAYQQSNGEHTNGGMLRTQGIVNHGYQAGNGQGDPDHEGMHLSPQHPLEDRRKQGFGASLKDKWRAFSRRRRSRRHENLELDRTRVKEIYGEVDPLRPGQFKPAPPPKQTKAGQRWKKVQEFARSPQRRENLEAMSRSPFSSPPGTLKPSLSAVGGTFNLPPQPSNSLRPATLKPPEPDYDSDFGTWNSHSHSFT